MNDDFKYLYDRISFLRNKKVKMKEMAERCGISPSVFSAIYSTVIPNYLKNIKEGKDSKDALDEALIWVNNVSKKRLLGSIADMKTALQTLKPDVMPEADTQRNPHLSMLRQAMADTGKVILNYTGIYTSYSISSSKIAMKEEPYLIVPAEGGQYVEVIHNSVYNSTHHGYALMNGLNHLYLTFNELQYPQLALYNICLKLPMYDRPPFLRGVYTCFDYNYNPVARRIVFVKKSESIDRDEFMKIKGRLVTESELTDEEKPYYQYTCGKTDIIRLSNIQQPQMTPDDLQEEKRSLGLL